MMSSGLPADTPGSSTPADWVNWPTFSSKVICLSRACARCWASGLKGNVWDFAGATARRDERADARTRADWSGAGERWKSILLRFGNFGLYHIPSRVTGINNLVIPFDWCLGVASARQSIA